MKFPLYKATSYKLKNSELFAGAVFSWNLWRFPDGPVVMMEAVRQKSYNPETKTGTFYNCRDNPDQGFRVKLGITEIGGILYAIRNYDSYKMYHNFDDNKTKIDFVTYAKKPKNEGDPPGKAFSLTVNRNGVAIGMGVELAEAEALRVFLEAALAEIFYASGQQQQKSE